VAFNHKAAGSTPATGIFYVTSELSRLKIYMLYRMTSAGDYTVLKQIIGNYSFQGGQAWTTSQPIITTNTTASTGQGTGALVVLGGASVTGNLYLGNTQVPITQYSTIGSGTNTITLPRSYSSATSYVVSLTFREAATATDTLYYTIINANSFSVTSSKAAACVAIGT
jgi:hypothetical protein